MALSHLASLKGLHLVNLNKSNKCVSTKVQNYLSEVIFQQKLEMSYVPMYHFVHSICRIIYNNVSSIVQKANFIKENQNMKSSHHVFSETWLTQEYPNEKFDMNNFTLYHMDNLYFVHHGMVVYIHKSVTLQYIHNISDHDMEAIKVQIVCKSYILTIVGLYLQPLTSLSRIQAFIRKILSNVPDKNMW